MEREAMKTGLELLEKLDQDMVEFDIDPFTLSQRRCVRMAAMDMMSASYREGQVAMIPHLCANRGSSFCPQTEKGVSIDDYEPQICKECRLDRGILI
ncbi:MAG: hypothetical protein LBK23_05075 [Oscillospiraceae bacterium]|jgi:hypothetical protein|nr:hypothetical protein [Oscillospiraceae bacterium]